MKANGFQEILTTIASIFRTIFDRLDHFYLVGNFSFLDALISFIIIDIIITALFVTFNVRVGGDNERVESHIGTEAREAIIRRSEEQSNYMKTGGRSSYRR